MASNPTSLAVRPNCSSAERARAALLGIACHGAFAAAIAALVAGLHTGMRIGLGGLAGPLAWASNAALTLQSPLLHSFALTGRGARLLDRVAPGALGRDLRSTSYALLAALQLLLVFVLWSPTGGGAVACDRSCAPARRGRVRRRRLLLGKGTLDAGLALQSGFLGWGAVARGRPPQYRALEARGLFRFTRQPIYLAFSPTLWTGPLMTPDRALLAVAWTGYCLAGPLLKEQRYLQRDPDGYGRYRALVPYWLPRLSLRSRESR